ncbi:hypothetical protein [Coleofasciculus sp.]|uniref:hypothetical protein n=1 Tax=Coleofasciculus sp. TaxID=3100458 RepID=UPI003A15889C
MLRLYFSRASLPPGMVYSEMRLVWRLVCARSLVPFVYCALRVARVGVLLPDRPDTAGCCVPRHLHHGHRRHGIGRLWFG